MWLAIILLLTAATILGYAFRELRGFAFVVAAAVALLLVLSALGPAAGHSMWWWVHAVRHFVAPHLAGT